MDERKCAGGHWAGLCMCLCMSCTEARLMLGTRRSVGAGEAVLHPVSWS